MTLLLFFILVFLFLALGSYRAQRRASHFSLLSWRELVGDLKKVHMEGITTLAMVHLDPSTPREKRSYEEILALVGGIEGLPALRHNADIFLILAARAEKHDLSEMSTITNQMRHDVLALRRAIISFSLSQLSGYHKARAVLYLQEAASAYYLMRQRLVSLYGSDVETHPILGDLV